jgi:hypothetical protein
MGLQRYKIKQQLHGKLWQHNDPAKPPHLQGVAGLQQNFSLKRFGGMQLDATANRAARHAYKAHSTEESVTLNFLIACQGFCWRFGIFR